jgi:hypothetical protein
MCKSCITFLFDSGKDASWLFYFPLSPFNEAVSSPGLIAPFMSQACCLVCHARLNFYRKLYPFFNHRSDLKVVNRGPSIWGFCFRGATDLAKQREPSARTSF